MKKRMFITTIVMMLVLAVALTTSSLAWFSSANSSVTATAATFTAKTKSDSVALKISNTQNNFGNSIALYKTEANNNVVTSISQKLQPLIPVNPLVSANGVIENGWKGAGVTHKIEGGEDVTVQPSYNGYVWPNKIDFNSAELDGNGNFKIDKSTDVNTFNITGYTDNNVEKYPFFYKSFYIKNADQVTSIDNLVFDVKVDMTADAGEYTANGIAAFILFDEMEFKVGDTIPSNASQYANLVVSEEGGDGKVAPQQGQTTVKAWVPFAAFTFNTTKREIRYNGSEVIQTADTNPTDSAWQFANLRYGTKGALVEKENLTVGSYFNDANEEINITADNLAAYRDGDYSSVNLYYINYAYSGIAPDKITATEEAPTRLYIQRADAATNKSAWGDKDEAVTTNNFKLDSESLQGLNNKIQNGDVAGRTSDIDTTSKFEMIAQEIYRVDMYYWLEGDTLNEYTDTTSSTISLGISVQ